MKIALILGRGIEGAGITRYCCELSSWLIDQGIKTDVYTIDDKKWPRRKLQSFKKDPIMINKSNISKHSEILDKYDYVFINSVPSVKHSQWAIDGFLKIIQDLSTKKILFQNDHKIGSIRRNANFFEICKLCDGIVSFSITSPFYKKLISLFGEDIKNRYIPLINGFNFDNLIKYRKEKHYKKITYLGRFAGFKQPERLFAFLPYSKQNKILLEMKGVERSIGAVHIFYDDVKKRIPRNNIYEVTKKTLANGLEIDNDKRDYEHIYIFPPYEYTEGMESLSTSLFGADFYHLDADAYGNSIEYAQCEVIGVGSIPLFDYHWAENTWVHKYGKKTDQRYIDVDYYGLFLKKDLSNVPEIVDKVNEIWSKPSLKKKYQECSLEVTKNHCDINYIYRDLLNNIKNIQKAKNFKNKTLF